MSDPRAEASELRCVAPLVSLATGEPQLVGTCTLVTNGTTTIAFSSAELLRKAVEPLAIVTALDGSSHVAIPAWSLGRRAGLGIIELAEGASLGGELVPLHLGQVFATLSTRGAPAAVVAIRAVGGSFARDVIGVHVDAADASGMSDETTALASPVAATDVNADGCPIFAWLPADPVLGRASEIVVVALGVSTRSAAKPRELAPLVELVGLDDLGRALPWKKPPPTPSSELPQVAGEIAVVAKDAKTKA